jgi:hypothetical protein
METNDKSMTAEESLQIIQKMIDQNKISLTDNSFYLLMWGWLSLAASLINVFLLRAGIGPVSYSIWCMLPIIGTPLSIWYARKYPEQSRTHMGFFIQNLWKGFGITFLILFVLVFFVHFPITFTFLLFLGTAIFITGMVTKFVPLLAGAIVFWISAILCITSSDPQMQLIIYAIAIFAGYIIPGYFLKNHYRKSHV